MMVTLRNKMSGAIKRQKIGWSWTCLFFSSVLGIPLFIRGLHVWGALSVIIWAVNFFVPNAAHSYIEEIIFTCVLLTAQIVFSFVFAITANRMAGRNYLRKWLGICRPGFPKKQLPHARNGGCHSSAQIRTLPSRQREPGASAPPVSVELWSAIIAAGARLGSTAPTTPAGSDSARRWLERALARLDGSKDLVLDLCEGRVPPVVLRVVEDAVTPRDRVALERLRSDLDRLG